MTRTSDPNQTLRGIPAHNPGQLASSTSRDARAIRSGRALREALLRLLEDKPFEQITIRDICAESGVHYATYFRHHATKESLLEAIAAQQIRELNELTLAVRDASDTNAGFRTLCAYVDEHRDLWSTLLNGGAGPAMRAEWIRYSMQVAATEPPVNSWLPSDLGTICAATLIAETLAWWLAQPREAYSVDQVAGMLVRLLTAAILAPD
jgi:AcrR family transcriptional regulator